MLKCIAPTGEGILHWENHWLKLLISMLWDLPEFRDAGEIRCSKNRIITYPNFQLFYTVKHNHTLATLHLRRAPSCRSSESRGFSQGLLADLEKAGFGV